MVAIPEVQRPPKSVRDHIAQWYEDHQFTYARVWERLDQIRQRWQFLDVDEKVALLKLSYLNSVFSIRTPVHIHEEWFARVVGGQDLESARAAAGAGLPARVDAIEATLVDHALWDKVVDLLDEGKIDTAHKLLIDEARYLGTAKAPFTLANLGFTQKMCVDGNVARLLGSDRTPETVDVARYEGLCADIQDMFPELSEQLDAYHLQWLLFDYQRFFKANTQGGGVQSTRETGMSVAQHDIWFDTALGDINHVRARMEALTHAAENGNGDFAPRDVDGDIDEAIRAALERATGDPDEAGRIADEIGDEIEAAVNGD